MSKVISMYGECEEGEDPQVIVREIMDGFDRLNKTGYRDLAVSTLEEAGIALRLAGHLNRKSSYRAKQDGDWYAFKNGIEDCVTENELLQWRIDNRSRIATCPNEWIEPLNELYERRKAELKKEV